LRRDLARRAVFHGRPKRRHTATAATAIGNATPRSQKDPAVVMLIVSASKICPKKPGRN
jgi:hypothetical protein